MKKTIYFRIKILTGFLFLSLISPITGIKAGNLEVEKAATLFYIVNLDDQMIDMFNQAKPKGEEQSVNSDKLELKSSVMDSIYAISCEVFKNDLGLELLPLNELHNKIKYNNQYPNCPNGEYVKKLVKTGSDYKFYADFYVNIYSGLGTSSIVKPNAKQIKPLYAISLTLYNKSGNVTLKKEFSYKSKDPLAESKKSKTLSAEEIKSKLYDYYR